MSAMGGRKLKTDSEIIPPPHPLKKPSLLGLIQERVGPREIKRRFWHMAPGLLPFVGWAVFHGQRISASTNLKLVLGFVLILVPFVMAQFPLIGRKAETGFKYKVLGYATPVLLMFLLFPSHFEMGFVVLIILAFGDGSATLAGLFFGGPKVPWNSKKTVAGFIAFVLIGGTLSTFLFWHQSNPHTPLLLAATCTGVATLVGAFAESLPLKGNDNFRVGVSAALTILAARTWIWGWPTLFALE